MFAKYINFYNNQKVSVYQKQIMQNIIIEFAKKTCKIIISEALKASGSATIFFLSWRRIRVFSGLRFQYI